MSFHNSGEGVNAELRHERNMPQSKAKKSYECKICGKKISESSNLVVHMRLHTNEKPYSCDECNKRFKHSGHLKLHLRLHHSDEKPFQCKICEQRFAQVVYFTKS